jgi:excinuclease ABC subunit A
VGTSTEIYDYLRLLFARIGITYCFDCGNVVKKDSVATVSNWLEERIEGEKFYLGFPIHKHKGRKVSEELALLKKKGFYRIFYKDRVIDLNSSDKMPRSKEGLYVIIERIKLRKGKVRETFAESFEVTFKEGEGKLTIINAETKEINNFNNSYECCGVKYDEPEPRFFSFNNPYGACPVCQGFGKTIGYDMKRVIPNENLSILEGAIAPWRTQKFSKHLRDLIRLSKEYKIPIDIPYKQLTDVQKSKILRGFDKFIGIDKFFKKLEQKTYKMHIRILLSKYRGYTTCAACKGSRLRREAMQVKINFKSMLDLVQLPIDKLYQFFLNLNLSEYETEIADSILKEINKRLKFLNDVGLGYLTLDRLSSTLSGGETQRINLATSLGSALIGTLYVLDEPSIGLHPRDNGKLISILKSLRDIGNTVLVVEHDKEMMEEADYIYDIGPGAGVRGGEIIAQGTFNEIKDDSVSLTGKYLSGEKKIPLPENRLINNDSVIKIKGASQNNLKNINVEIPLRKFVCITGVSGSGKSTLVHDILYGGIAKILGKPTDNIGKYESIEGILSLEEVEIVDQSPIGKSPRSNPISYVKGYEIIRDIFASTPQSRIRGYKPGYFSFNVDGGRCETCKGEGYVQVEMQFLADLYLECDDCKGTRFKKELREVTFKGKNIVDVLNFTVAEAIDFFDGNDRILTYLRVLDDVGLGYIHLGQPSNTLSGGEAQRIKLAKHLISQRKNKNTLFIFDEPTTGLHFDDINKLLNCFNVLVEKKNSLVIIEHNLDVIKCADYVIDLGPDAGENGGEVVAVGTPEQISENNESVTGKYLRPLLS